ncbi:type II secretion system F family protein [Bacillus timonensis]|nr:type II secretion system F family protein [Bacillus timonensis]
MIKKNNWSLKEQYELLKRLGELLENGYTFSQAVGFLSIQFRTECQKDLQRFITALKEGETIYQFLTSLNFHKDVLAYLYFSEKHGDLSFALKQASSILKTKMFHLDTLKKLIRYPLFLVCMVLGMFFVIKQVLVPQFEMLYFSMQGSDTYYRVFMNLVYIPSQWFLIGAIMILILLLFTSLTIKKLTPKKRMMIFTKIPLLRTYIKLNNSHFFSVQLSNLLKGGLSIYEALKVFERISHSSFFKVESKDIVNSLSAGERLDELIMNSSFYEGELGLVIAHGQANGNLERELFDYSQFCLKRTAEMVERLLRILQPTLFTVIGVMIIFMYLIIMLPMYQLIQSI